MTQAPPYPLWRGAWREETWARAAAPLDVLVVGGGITGAGVLREAARRGLSALLVDAGDFASGTSSRSGQLVHGGMRYLKHLRIGLTRTLLLERDRLLRAHPGLVEPLEFVLPTYRTSSMDRLQFGVAVRAYDILRLKRRSWRRYGPEEVAARLPGVLTEGLDGGFSYTDAVTDDARLVLRTLREASGFGAIALNYARVEGLIRENGRVVGAEITDLVSRESHSLRAAVVFNATGAQADVLRGEVGEAPRFRPIRGTHLVFSQDEFPLSVAGSVRHPVNGRYIYFIPWEGATLVGTTEVDDPAGAALQPQASRGEVDYLMEALEARLPEKPPRRERLLAAYAGVRPVVGTGTPDPYRESRDSVLWEEDGLVTVVSGKLTGFHPIVQKALRAFGRHVRGNSAPPRAVSPGDATLEGVDALEAVEASLRTRLVGRYGTDAVPLVDGAKKGEMERIPGTHYLWAEIRWGLRGEGVVHLDDLLLRRARVGLLLPNGGAGILPRVRTICQEELGWDDERWTMESDRYLQLWRDFYAPPETG